MSRNLYAVVHNPWYEMKDSNQLDVIVRFFATKKEATADAKARNRYNTPGVTYQVMKLVPA